VKTKEQKRIEAEARQVAYDALTPLAKLARLDARRGASGRERARIEAAK
jgi:hypothetical protein